MVVPWALAMLPVQRKRPVVCCRTQAHEEMILARLALSAIDDWRSSQNGELTRADALRRIAAVYFGFPVEVADQKVLAAEASICGEHKRPHNSWFPNG